MFEAAEIGHAVPKAEYDKRIPDLRVRLVNAQYDLRARDFSVVVVLAGVDRPGCTELLHDLHDIMDGRYILTNALGRPTDEERAHPRFWRYWRRLPRRGQIGAFLAGWPVDAIADRIWGDLDDVGFAREIEHIRRFEDTLAADGVLFLKFWLHLPRAVLRKRLKQARKHPRRRWQIDGRDRRLYKRYGEVLPVAERLIRDTSTGAAPWYIVESSDEHYRDLRVGETVLAGIEQRLAMPARTRPAPSPTRRTVQRRQKRTVLDTIDLSRTLTHPTYRSRLERLQARINRLTVDACTSGLTSVLVLEGWDAAGKGGVIRRLTAAMNPEIYDIVPIAAPTDEERAHHYLWRFWRRLPGPGRIVVFDRSWYGRVLVERVEGLASETEWRRAYDEITNFEAQLTEHGIVVLKFWLHIDPDEQLRRFRERQQTPYKKYKITAEDFRNREKWRQYAPAVHEMVARTSTVYAPWHLIAANDKRWARVEVLRTYARSLKKGLKQRPKTRREKGRRA